MSRSQTSWRGLSSEEEEENCFSDNAQRRVDAGRWMAAARV